MSTTMPRVSLYQSREKVEQIPRPRPLHVSLLVSRCLSIGPGSSVKRPVATVAKTRSNWRASLQHSTLPAITSPPSPQLSAARRGGNSETQPVLPQHRPPSNVQRITVDLRSALARVREPCQPTDEALDDPTASEEAGRDDPPNPGDTTAFDRSQQPAEPADWKPDPRPQSRRSRSNERSFESLKIKMLLPPIANRPGERQPPPRGPPASSAHSPKVGLLQVTRDSTLANPDHDCHSVRGRSNQLAPFPKIFLTTSPSTVSLGAECAPRRERILTNLHVKEINQSFEQSIKDSTIPFHQLLHQMRKRTSSANHVLITEVLKCLREELWLTSQQPKNGQNERDAIGPLYTRRSIPFCRRAENRLDGQARSIYQSSPMRRNKSPVKLSLSKNRSL